MKTKNCTSLFAHSMENMEMVNITKHLIVKRCPKCGFTETLPRSGRGIYFVNQQVLQKKKWAAEDNKKELLQPLSADGSVNNEFTEAFGFNPMDPRTKLYTPRVQGGLAK